MEEEEYQGVSFGRICKVAFHRWKLLLILTFSICLVGFFGVFIAFHFTKRINEAENMVRRVCVAQSVRLDAGRERKGEHKAGEYGLAAIDHQVDGGAAFGLLGCILFVFRKGGAACVAVPFADSCLLFFFLLFSHDG